MAWGLRQRTMAVSVVCVLASFSLWRKAPGCCAAGASTNTQTMTRPPHHTAAQSRGAAALALTRPGCGERPLALLQPLVTSKQVSVPARAANLAYNGDHACSRVAQQLQPSMGCACSGACREKGASSVCKCTHPPSSHTVRGGSPSVMIILGPHTATAQCLTSTWQRTIRCLAGVRRR